jgi:hypothetical protein
MEPVIGRKFLGRFDTGLLSTWLEDSLVEARLKNQTERLYSLVYNKILMGIVNFI